MIKAFLLDVDGTLIDSNDAHTRAWLEALDEFGFPAAYGTVRDKIGMGGDHLLPEVLGISSEEGLGEQISKRRGEIFRSKYLKELQPFPQTREFISELLSRGLKVIIATSAPQADLKGLLSQAGIDDLLTDCTSSDDAESSKPDPDIVQAALAKAGCLPEEALMVGDTPYDIEAAAKAGVRCLAVMCGGWPHDKLTGAAAVFAGPWELLDFLRQPSALATVPGLSTQP